MRALWLLLLLCLMPHPATARWIVAETPHFRIHSDGGERAVRERAATLEDFHALLEMLTGRKVPGDAPKLDIYEVGSRAQLLTIVPTIGADVGGFYHASWGGIAAVVLRGSALRTEDVLLHEYAHHFMFQVGAAALPAWYVEGFAEYMMTARFTDDRIEFGLADPLRMGWLGNGVWLPADRLLTGTCATLKRDECAMFYAQSWLLTHHMFRAEGMRDRLKDYLGRVASGEPSLAAWSAAVGDPKGLNKRLQAYAAGRTFTMTRVKRTPPAPADVRLTVLPPGADAALIPLLSLTLPQKEETDQANLARVRAAAAAAPADPFAARALAIAESIAGDREKAAARLDALLAASPDDAELLLWRANLHDPVGRDATPENRSAARRLLVRAFKAAPSDWRVLYRYASSFPADRTPASVVEVWALAAALAPQVRELGMSAGLALARAGRFTQAYIALAPTVFDPHAAKVPPGLLALAAALRAEDKARVEAALAALDREPEEAQPEAPQPSR
jgi:tetratricopeptide (TPR) repeat protein